LAGASAFLGVGAAAFWAPAGNLALYMRIDQVRLHALSLPEVREAGSHAREEVLNLLRRIDRCDAPWLEWHPPHSSRGRMRPQALTESPRVRPDGFRLEAAAPEDRRPQTAALVPLGPPGRSATLGTPGRPQHPALHSGLLASLAGLCPSAPVTTALTATPSESAQTQTSGHLRRCCVLLTLSGVLGASLQSGSPGQGGDVAFVQYRAALRADRFEGRAPPDPAARRHCGRAPATLSSPPPRRGARAPRPTAGR
jgi:hypothetical protein